MLLLSLQKKKECKVTKLLLLFIKKKKTVTIVEGLFLFKLLES